MFPKVQYPVIIRRITVELGAMPIMASLLEAQKFENKKLYKISDVQMENKNAK